MVRDGSVVDGERPTADRGAVERATGPVVNRRPAGPRRPRPTTEPLRRPDALPVRQRVVRAVFLVLLTLVVPGAAQIAAGNRWVGRLAVRIWLSVLGVVVALAGLWFLSRTVVLHLATSWLVLSLVAIFLSLVGIAWPVLVVDAWRLGRPALLPRRARLGMTGLLVLSVLVTSVPVIGAGRRVWAAASLLDGVFGMGVESAAVQGRYNVLLLGGDAGPDRPGTRPDSLTLASIDATSGRTVLFSLPRNLEDVRFPEGSSAAKAKPEGWTCGDECLLNGIYTWGVEHRDAFPGVRDPGAEAMKQAVEGVTGLKVNYYVLVDLKGFRRLIDAMGGIDLTVRDRVPIGGGTSRVSGYIEPGTQHLDGYHALWYARSRHGASDYARMERQRCVMNAMVRQMDPATLLAKFQGIAAAAQDVMSTDIPASELATFISLGSKGKSQKITSVAFTPPLVNPAYPDFDLIQDRVVQALVSSRREAAAPSAAPTASPSLVGMPAAGGLSGVQVSSAATVKSSRTASASASPLSSAAAATADPVDVGAACAPA
ncbi:MAG: LCP family protein [Kineosporiaceae bacterium]|nr:LCP family protein [Kineosporiaceae bacterium]